MNMRDALDIIIVNWNTSDLLFTCLDSVIATNRSKITVIDNASTDDSLEMLSRLFPCVEVINNSENVGYAKANNQGIQKTKSEYVCLLNSDTVASPEVMEKMLEFMSGCPDSVACAPALRLPNGKLQTGGAGFELSLTTAFNYFFFLSKLFPFKCKGFYLDQEAYVRLCKPAKVDWLAGACLMVRKSAIDTVGGLNESYFMYAEDAEWCDRLRNVGNIYYLPHLEIIHYHGASSNNSNTVSTKWLEATFKYFQSKYNTIQSQVFRVIVGCGFLTRMLIYYCLSINNNKWLPKYKAMARYLIFTIKWNFKQ